MSEERPTIRLTDKSTDSEPLTMLVSSETAHAVFRDREDASRYLHHPGMIPNLAKRYIEWIDSRSSRSKEPGDAA